MKHHRPFADWPRPGRCSMACLPRVGRSIGLLPALLVVAVAVAVSARSAAGAEERAFSAAEIEHFERRIRPLLHRRCYSCHAADATVLQGGLRVDSRQQLLTGGDSGPAIVPGKPEASLLIEAIRYGGDSYDMPPEGKLPEEEIRLLEDWVARGAPFPSPAGQDAAPQQQVDVEAGRQFWSFQPLQRPQPPALPGDDWSRGAIDPFILAGLRDRGLEPSPRADRATLIRRLSFDLVGLPPTPAAVADFLADPSPGAYDSLVDRLLASPEYGQRWGRMWLDLVRYADTTESWLGDTPHAYLYRDWVIEALNHDLPYDRFVRRQLATDLIDATDLDDLPALGLFGISPTYFKELLLPPEIIKVIVADEWEERVDAFGRTFLGLTVACARCHDHKFDPITTEDYYGLAGVFASMRMTQRPMVPEAQYAPAATAKQRVAELQQQLTELGKQKPKPEDEIAQIRQEIEQLQTTPLYHAPLAHVVDDQSLHVELAGDDPQSGSKLVYRDEPRDLQVFIRGNPNRLGKLVPRRFLTVLSDDQPRPLQQGSGRLDLADAMLEDATALLARVIVNRVWQGHFGRGLVDTPSNFGRLGSPPSHPELLEALAAGLVDNGWSIKWLHRQIVGSAVYQQSSQRRRSALEIDPENIWLWRARPRRLQIEPWRDAMLAVGGDLDLRAGGPSLPLDDPANQRRTVYTTVHRTEVAKPLLMHDFPNPELHSPQRMQTTTPLQALYTLNSPFVMQRGERLAERLFSEHPDDVEARIERAHLLLFARPPTSEELQLGLQFLQQAPEATWAQYTHALLASNEFLFID